MSGLTYTEIFGANATLDTTDIENPKVIIPLEAISNDEDLGLGGDTGIWGVASIGSNNIDFWANRIFYGFLLRYLQKQPTTNTDPTLPIHMTNLGKKNVTRGGEAQVAFTITVNAYMADPLSNVMYINDLIS